MKKGQKCAKMVVFEVRLPNKMFYDSYKGVGNKVF